MSAPRTIQAFLAALALSLAGCASEKPGEEIQQKTEDFGRGVAQPQNPPEQTMCGGSYGACPDQYYCEANACGVGVCRARPTECAPIVRPVCGCDGKTWASICEAQQAGVDSSYVGACFVPPFIPSATPELPDPAQP